MHKQNHFKKAIFINSVLLNLLYVCSKERYLLGQNTMLCFVLIRMLKLFCPNKYHFLFFKPFNLFGSCFRTLAVILVSDFCEPGKTAQTNTQADQQTLRATCIHNIHNTYIIAIGPSTFCWRFRLTRPAPVHLAGQTEIDKYQRKKSGAALHLFS